MSTIKADMSFLSFKSCVFFIIWKFLAISTILGKFWQFWGSFKDTSRWFWPTFFFSVSFPCWLKVKMIIWREKIHIFPTFSVAQIGGVECAQIKFASQQSSCSSKSSECPIWTWNTSKSSWDLCVSNGALLSLVRPLQR